MCGRFVATGSPKQLAGAFNAIPDATSQRLRPSFNVAPTESVPAVRTARGQRILSAARWGFLAPWIKSATQRPQPINARAEKLTGRMYKAAFTRLRVVIPADGFYEWQTTPDGTKIPFFVHHADGQRLCLAGIASWWADPVSEAEAWLTVAIVTTDPGQQIRDLHDRQPVLLTAEGIQAWLDPHANRGRLLALTSRRDVIPLVTRQVSTDVNSPRNDHPGLLDPAG